MVVKNLGFCVLAVAMAACSTLSGGEVSPAPSSGAQSPASGRVGHAAPPKRLHLADYDIDYPGLQRFLHLEASKTDLGFAYKPFQSCQVGYGLPRSQFCQTLYFNVVRFRLQCRDSEGTTSTIQSAANLTAIADTDIQWNIGKTIGGTATDHEGFGEILAITFKNAKNDRIKLSNGHDFLYMRVSEVTRVVTPSSWCP